MYTNDPHAFQDPEAVARGKYRPRVRLNADGQGVVSLNLFPLSEKGALRLCVKFDLEKNTGDKDKPIWWKWVQLVLPGEYRLTEGLGVDSSKGYPCSF
jgi:hypothetical protein